MDRREFLARAAPGTTFAERNADARAFERLTLPYLGDVARFARALTRDVAQADDLAQETYLQALRGWHTFRPGADARRWLFTVCHHTFLRSARREARYVNASDGDAAPGSPAARAGAAPGRAPPAGAGDAAERMDVAAALAAHYRGAVVLVDVEGQSYETAALTLGVAVGTVRSRLFRGRRRLQHGLRVYAYDAGLLTPRAGRRARPPQARTP